MYTFLYGVGFPTQTAYLHNCGTIITLWNVLDEVSYQYLSIRNSKNEKNIPLF